MDQKQDKDSTDRMKIRIEKHKKKYVAYPVGLEGLVVGEGKTREEAIANVKSAIKSYREASEEESYTVYPRHIVAVMGIVRNSKGKVLLTQTLLRGWEPPGGQVENGEDIFTALKREVLEETGIEVETGKLVAIYSNVTSRPTKLILTFEANVVGGKLQAGGESLDTGWFSPEEAIDKVIHPAQKQKLQDALLSSGSIIYRVYGTDPYELLKTVIV